MAFSCFFRKALLSLRFEIVLTPSAPWATYTLSPGLLQRRRLMSRPKCMLTQSHHSNYSTATSGRPVTRRQDEIKWQELLTHFRQIQFKHERARRSALHHTGNPHLYTLDNMEPASLPMASAISAGHSNASRITSRRKVNGQGTMSRNSAGGENATKRGTSKAGSTSAHSRPLSPPVSSTGGISRRIASSAQQPITRR